jgi:23S rRNA (uridine2552-2'-O)-methyltransferase
MARTGSSRRWLKEHHQDPFVKQAKQAGYRSRAAYKLLEIDRRDRLLRPGTVVVDLGAAPGGWAQVAAERLAGKGRVLALDILPVEPIPGVEVLTGDFTQDATLAALEAALGGASVDLVLSDLAPNASGIAAVDQPRAMLLAELAADFAARTLAPGGALVAKVFQGEGFDDLIRALKQSYRRVYTRKPEASRARSREVYVLARDYRV